MRLSWMLLGAIVMGACDKPREAPLPPPPTFSLGDVAGTWKVQAFREGSDSVLVEYQIAGTSDPAAWTMTLTNRPPMALRVSVDGDSLIAEAGPYESVLRPGVVVVAKTISRLQGGKMVGTFSAKYATRMVDSVLTGRIEATRMP